MTLSEVHQDRLDRAKAEFAQWQDTKFAKYFPDCLPACRANSPKVVDHAGFCRLLYRKHVAFMAAGREHRERLFLAANQIGKTQAAAYEVVCHLTGLYPPWWQGRVFDHPTEWWVAGDTMLTTRDILQVSLMGPVSGLATETWAGMVPPHLVLDFARRSGGVKDCLEQVDVLHVTGDRSILQFRSYDQGRRSFQGTAKHGIWLDEEPPDTEDIYSECLTRTVTTNGLVIQTFTPLRGLTPFLQQYLQTATMLDDAGQAKPAMNVFFPEPA